LPFFSVDFGKTSLSPFSELRASVSTAGRPLAFTDLLSTLDNATSSALTITATTFVALRSVTLLLFVTGNALPPEMLFDRVVVEFIKALVTGSDAYFLCVCDVEEHILSAPSSSGGRTGTFKFTRVKKAIFSLEKDNINLSNDLYKR